MIIRSRAPLRLGLAGGGTDIKSFCEQFGGAILNATINLFATAAIEPRNDGKIILNSIDLGLKEEMDSQLEIPIKKNLLLLKGVYNRIVKDYVKEPLSFTLTTSVDVPKGSGLGASSTLTVAILGAFMEWLGLPMGEYEIAHFAHDIERNDLGMAGGQQDQYAATFGGFNYMEFDKNDFVIVNPLRIKEEIIRELESTLVIYFTGRTRKSDHIIRDQKLNFELNTANANAAGKRMKEIALEMKNALLRGHIDHFGKLLHKNWEEKKKTSPNITNPRLDHIYEAAINAGAKGGKISGAGGGGFFLFYAPGTMKYQLLKHLKQFGGHQQVFTFAKRGLYTWKFS